MRSFFTGSRIYGQPREDSDLDLCVHCDSAHEELLFRNMSDGYGGSGFRFHESQYFGNLNVILLNEREFEGWARANRRLIEERPVTKERAIQVINEELGERTRSAPVPIDPWE